MKAYKKALLRLLENKELLYTLLVLAAVAAKLILPTDGIQVPAGDV